mgnify:CR=1 FL=1
MTTFIPSERHARMKAAMADHHKETRGAKSRRTPQNGRTVPIGRPSLRALSYREGEQAKAGIVEPKR